MNTNRKQYIIIGMEYPEKLSYFLLKLEQFSNWDLRLDDIYVIFTDKIDEYTFKDVKDRLLSRRQCIYPEEPYSDLRGLND